MRCHKRKSSNLTNLLRVIARQATALVCAMVLALQLVAPAQAHANGGDATWIEICGDAGPEMALVDLTGSSGGEPCVDCGDCVLCMVSSPLTTTPSVTVLRLLAMDTATYPRFDADIPENPSKFWPDNRGPPRVHSDVYPAETPAFTAQFPFERRAL